jgi:hypothetical protein
VTFLTMAISNMLVIVFIEKILKRSSSQGSESERSRLSYKRKLRLFACVVILTSLLLYFFYQHRFLCKPLGKKLRMRKEKKVFFQSTLT